MLTMTRESNNTTVKDRYLLILEIFWLTLLIPPSVLWAFFRKLFPPAKKSIHDKVALVTGGASGLGKGLALRLAKEGCRVAIVDIDEVKAAETAEQICNLGGKAKSYRANVADLDDVRSLRKAVMEDLGPVDLLINNAGILRNENIIDCSDESVTDVINVNLISHFWMTREFLSSMLERNAGHIVCIASTCSFVGVSNASYTVSKQGVKGFMEVLRSELNAYPGNEIKTTTVFPYFMDSTPDYLKLWDLRLPALSVNEVVEETIAAVRRDEVVLTVPRNAHFLLHFIRLFPQHIIDRFHQITYTRFTPMYKKAALRWYFFSKE